MSFFGRLKAGLGKTASRLTETITSVVKKRNWIKTRWMICLMRWSCLIWALRHLKS
jgi:hypothetical protein